MTLEFIKAHPIAVSISVGVVLVLVYMMLSKPARPMNNSALLNSASSPTTGGVPASTPVASITAPVTSSSTPVYTTAPVTSSTPAGTIQRCIGGAYCNGLSIPDSAAVLGSVVCGAGSGAGAQFKCMQLANGTLGWQPTGTACTSDMINACH